MERAASRCCAASWMGRTERVPCATTVPPPTRGGPGLGSEGAADNRSSCNRAKSRASTPPSGRHARKPGHRDLITLGREFVGAAGGGLPPVVREFVGAAGGGLPPVVMRSGLTFVGAGLTSMCLLLLPPSKLHLSKSLVFVVSRGACAACSDITATATKPRVRRFKLRTSQMTPRATAKPSALVLGARPWPTRLR